MLRSAIAYLLLLSVLTSMACEILGPAADVPPPHYVVESYQIAGESLSSVTVRKTTDLGRRYHTADNGLSGADVQIEQLSADGSIDRAVSFRERSSAPGTYVPVDTAIVRPLTRYRLVVHLQQIDRTVTAETVVPDTFTVAGAPSATVHYRSGDNLSFQTTASRYPNRQSIYLLDLRALDGREEQLTPPARELMQGGETDLDAGGGLTLKQMRRAEWGPVNEEVFRSDVETLRTITVPWDKIAFFGLNRIDAYVIDDNLYEIIRSDAAQENSAAPGEIPPVVDHVKGGTGVFAGMARARYEVFVSRP